MQKNLIGENYFNIKGWSESKKQLFTLIVLEVRLQPRIHDGKLVSHEAKL